MFTGFEYKVPEFEVITPQTKESFTLRTLTVGEETNLKGSLLVTNKTAINHLNKILFNCIVKKPEEIQTEEDFLKRVTIKDRDALVYGLNYASYGEKKDFDYTCKFCGQKSLITINLDDAFNIEVFPEEENILEKRVIVQLPVLQNVKVVIKQPTLYDEIDLQKRIPLGTNEDTSINILVIEKFLQDKVESKEPLQYTSIEDIITAYESLTPRDRKAIHKEYYENFGKYSIDLKTKVICKHCKESDSFDIDLVEMFFRNLYEI